MKNVYPHLLKIIPELELDFIQDVYFFFKKLELNKDLCDDFENILIPRCEDLDNIVEELKQICIKRNIEWNK